MRTGRLVSIVLAVSLVLAATGCGDGDTPSAAPTPTPTADPTGTPTGEPSAAPTTPTATPSPSPTPTPSPSPTPTPSPSPTPSPEPTSSPSPTTGPTPTVDPCDPAEMLALADESIGQARIAVGAEEWSVPAEASAFLERTRTGAEFASANGLSCGVEATRTGTGGSDQLLLAAWTGGRYAMVIQLTDVPTEPFAADATFDLLFEEAEGEWVGPDFWAATLSGGETFLLRVADYSTGAAAKSWQAGVVEPPPAPTSIPAEAYAVAALQAAGAQNVGVAEYPEIGSQVASIAFQTPEGAVMIATVAPVGWFEPDFTSLSGPTTTTTMQGIEVFVTEPGPDDFGGAEVGFIAVGEDHVWRIELGFGTLDELLAWTEQLIPFA